MNPIYCCVCKASVALAISVSVSRGCKRNQLTRTLKITSRSLVSIQLIVRHQRLRRLSTGLINVPCGGLIPDIARRRKILSSVKYLGKMEENEIQVSRGQEDCVVKNTETIRNYSENNLARIIQNNMAPGNPTVHPVLSDDASEVSTTRPSNGNKDMLFTGILSQSKEPGTETLVSSEPGTETLVSSEPGTETLVSSKPGTETVVSSEPGTETLVSSEPGTETLVSSKPGTETLMSSEPGTETAVSSKPGTEILVSSEPGTETAVSSKPGTETLVSSEPGTDTIVKHSSSCEDVTKPDLSDSSSLGMEMLFDEGSPSDTSTLGLVKLFDETIQAQDAENWEKKGKKANKLSKNERKWQKRKLNVSLESEDGAVEIEANDKREKQKKIRKPTPNYFVAVRVSNPEIHASLRNVQEAVVEHDLKLKPALIPLGTLHLTLMVMYLENKDEIEKAKSVLHECKDNIMPLFCEQQLTMSFTGLDHFRNAVLYSKVADQDQVDLLKSVAVAVRERYANAGISSTDDREFQPHLTVMKLSRNPKLRRKGIKKIPKESYSEFINEHFGVENACALHLCSMVHKKTEDGFYSCIETANFSYECSSAKYDCSPSLEISQEVKEAVKSVREDNEKLKN